MSGQRAFRRFESWLGGRNARCCPKTNHARCLKYTKLLTNATLGHKTATGFLWFALARILLRAPDEVDRIGDAFMRICGIKLTHDGAIALVEDGRLVFCVEQEKRGNNPRYQAIENLDEIVAALAEHGMDSGDVDQFVIDGWMGDVESQFEVLSGAAPITLKGGPYLERRADGLLIPRDGFGLMLDGRVFPYTSYPHVTGHVASAYCTSPFAKAGQPAFCLVWDGSTFPRLYYVERRGARFLECLFPMTGHAYASAGHHFGPYKRADRTEWDLGVAGKLMAYIALGSVDEDIVAVFQELYEERFAADTEVARRYSAAASRGSVQDHFDLRAAVHDFFDATALRLKASRPEDVLASFHCFVERLLVCKMAIVLRRHSCVPGPRNLCITGGCGLNIKWNSAVRATGLFDAVWVPPVPNDSGSAIGAACCAMAAQKGFIALEWSVYSGPALRRSEAPPEWEGAPCELRELATILASNKPVIFLAGRAELGPRALGSSRDIGRNEGLSQRHQTSRALPASGADMPRGSCAGLFQPRHTRSLHAVRSSDTGGMAGQNPRRCTSRRICPIANYFQNVSAQSGRASRRIRETDGHSASLQHECQPPWTWLLPGCRSSLPVGTR
ncbi:putative NodU family carbamoyl transferase [Bradyrhizobium sp. USDA 10063]